MTIGEILRYKDIDTYRKLKRIYKSSRGRLKRPEIKLGDRVENLMKSDSYCRSGRRIKQRGWG